MDAQTIAQPVAGIFDVLVGLMDSTFPVSVPLLEETIFSRGVRAETSAILPQVSTLPPSHTPTTSLLSGLPMIWVQPA